MGERYIAQLTIVDVRNGESVKTLNNIEIEDGVFAESEIERIEEFVGVAVSEYEQEVYA